MLEIKNLSISYQNQQVIHSSSLQVKTGITCIIGPSGAGKTSILNALTYQIPFDCSEYHNGSVDLKNLSPAQVKAYIRQNYAYFVQGNNFISDLSCYDNIKLYAQMAGIECDLERIQELLEMVELSITEKTYPDHLSGGEKQRLALAQALAKNTDIIICDEFTASLDEDLKLDIFDLLKIIVQKYHKTIILTSHDPDVYEQCDTLYEIVDGKLVLQRETVNTLDQPTEAKISRNVLLDKKFFKKYVKQKMNRQFFMNLLYSVVCALVVSISMFLIHYRSNYINEQNKILDRLSQTELIAVNQTTPKINSVATFSYMEFNKPFSLEVNQQILALQDAQVIYPYYMWFTQESMTSFSNNEQMAMTFSKAGEDDIVKYVSSDYDYVTLQPYYPEQYFEKKQNVINEETTTPGAFINRNLFYMLGLTEEDLKDRTLHMKAYAPVAYKASSGTATDAETHEQTAIEMYLPFGTPVEIDIPITGIIDRYYDEITAGYTVYLLIDMMESLRKEATADYEVQDGYLPWSCNAYTLFATEADKLESLNIALSSIDPLIATGNKYKNSSAIFAQNNYIKQYTLIAVGSTIGVGLALAYAFGIFYYHKNKEDQLYFVRNGLTKQEFNQLLITDCSIQSLLVIVLSVFVSVIIFFIGKDYPIYLQKEFIFGQMPRNILCTLLLAIMQTVISRMVYFNKTRK